MFGRDAVTNLSQLTKPKLRYMGTEDLILDLELMSSIFQTQIHNLRMARERVIEGQQPVKKPNIEVGDLVLVRDHTSKCFMPKYKVDFRVVRVQGNRAEVKDNNGKLTWYHISDIKKTMYFRPVIHGASCFALTSKISWIFLCVMPVPKKFKI